MTYAQILKTLELNYLRLASDGEPGWTWTYIDVELGRVTLFVTDQ
jgi:hypothetical protein